MKLLSLYVFKHPLADCTNGGASSKSQVIYIPCETGPTDASDVDPGLIFLPEQRGTDYWALKPLRQKDALIGPMAGGNLAYSSDSRCPRVFHIHDRYETTELNNLLST